MSQPPTLSEAIKATQHRLREKLGAGCTIETHTTLTEDLLRTVLFVDSQKFRSELWYKHEEVLTHGLHKGFILILAHCGDKPIGLAYGYDKHENGYFLDTLASMVEGKGIGTILATLVLIHALERGCNHVNLYTEERDEKGHMLRKFYEHIGFRYLGTEEGKGDVMYIQLDPDRVNALYTRHIA
jgi:GNAT superfamily N-acetyltransferase